MFTEKYHWPPWKKEGKKAMRLGWSRDKFAIATTFQQKHQVRFKLSYTNQVYQLEDLKPIHTSFSETHRISTGF